MKHILFLLVLMSFTYKVQCGDTLDSIAHQYFKTDNPTEFAILKEGIREHNYKIIGEGEVSPGMILEINRFDKE